MDFTAIRDIFRLSGGYSQVPVWNRPEKVSSTFISRFLAKLHCVPGYYERSRRPCIMPLDQFHALSNLGLNMKENIIKQILIKAKLLQYPLTDCLLKCSNFHHENSRFKVLDIGCGNHAPSRLKAVLPNADYTGVDIQEYNIDEQDKKNTDRLLILNPDDFSSELDFELEDSEYDFIIMNHVIEHLNDPFQTLETLVKKMAQSGTIYLSFPSEQSIFFPSAQGTLNFYDDSTHVWIPSIREILNFLSARSITPEYVIERNRGGILQQILAAGKIPYVFLSKLFQSQFKADSLLWYLYGFESIIIAQSRR
jgi:2-polyprenyl-3-methyl-5-hydroxy-6-metoxy-1,4-benzoquinol methylase